MPIVILAICCNAIGQSNERLTNIPTLYIDTENDVEIDSKDDYVAATLTCISLDDSQNLSADIKIRGRGNSTWSMPKKPYRIKFSSKLHFLNLPAKQDTWVLLANYADKTLMRNGVATELSTRIGFDFTPSTQFVDVVLNGDSIGTYIVTDQMEVKSDRIDVDKLDNAMTTLPDITGGFFLEADGFADGDVKTKTAHGMNIVLKYPDEDDVNESQKQYIFSYVQKFEDALFSSNFKDEKNGYRKYIDIPSFVNWYLSSEITGNPDCFWSTYFYKRRNDPLLRFGPLWDFDIAFNNDSRLGDATNKLMANAAHEPRQWIIQFLKDPWLREQISKRWVELKNENIQQALLDYVDATRVDIDQSQKINFHRWNVLSNIVYLELAARGTYQAEVDFLRSYIVKRFAFLDTQFLPEEITTGVNERITARAQIFPNPVNAKSVVTFELMKPSPVQIIVYDAAGNILNSKTTNANEGVNTVSLADHVAGLSNGIYVLKLTTAQTSTITKKIIVLR